MENPSLRVSGDGGSESSTFIVEDFIEDEFGPWATDEVTREQRYVDDEGSFLLGLGTTQACSAVQTI